MTLASLGYGSVDLWPKAEPPLSLEPVPPSHRVVLKNNKKKKFKLNMPLKINFCPQAKHSRSAPTYGYGSPNPVVQLKKSQNFGDFGIIG